MRVLVAIANYGFKNEEYLKRLIKEYKSMPCDIDIIILSNVHKEFKEKVEVAVGLPSKDPWSLPFEHKKIFAERLEEYDLFIYSEDDMLITWRNIESFLQVTRVLSENYIIGFVQYELDSVGRRWYPSFHGSYHWLPDSVRNVGQYTFAQFSNVHSACYVMTRDQLKRAIGSGGYLVGPHKGRYDMLCSAATDPYTQCGFRKLICISHISEFLIHHLPDRYVESIFGINESDFDKQIAFMLSPEYVEKSGQELFVTRKNIDHIRWDKMYYIPYDRDLLSLISPRAKRILSVGCGCASSETMLVQKGIEVVAIPLDSIVAVVAQSKGIRVTEPDLERAFLELDGTRFDCILFPDVLQHMKDPVEVLSRSVKFLANDGEVLISIPNFCYLKFLKEHLPYPILKRWTYEKNLIHVVTKGKIKKWFDSSGLNMFKIQYTADSRFLKSSSLSLGFFNGLFADRIYVVGKI
jgi:2-polyprenyl-3-methyl-5-hydroxy-6-metoxy-1,4-benzoquinol methylase